MFGDIDIEDACEYTLSLVWEPSTIAEARCAPRMLLGTEILCSSETSTFTSVYLGWADVSRASWRWHLSLSAGACSQVVASALHLLRLALSVSVPEGTEASSHNHAFLLLSAHGAVVWDAATVTGNQSWAWKLQVNLADLTGVLWWGLGILYFLPPVSCLKHVFKTSLLTYKVILALKPLLNQPSKSNLNQSASTGQKTWSHVCGCFLYVSYKVVAIHNMQNDLCRDLCLIQAAPHSFSHSPAGLLSIEERSTIKLQSKNPNPIISQ